MDSVETQSVTDNRKLLKIAMVLVLVLLVFRTFFTVSETQFALITQFGRPMRTIAQAGLHVKWPYQSATYFDRRLRIYNPRPSEFLTRDKKNIVIDSYVAWKIEDPDRFVQAVGDAPAAEMRLHDVVWSGLSAVLGTHDLDTLVSATDKVDTADLLNHLTESIDSGALRQYGIQVVDVQIMRLNLPEQNKQSVYARMRAERERIARQYRAEGEEQALSIRADADKQKEEILSEAYESAEKVRGQGDAQSTEIYGAAYSKNPQLYKLLRTLETYKKVLDDKTTAILSSDSELLKILTKGPDAAR